MRYSVIIAILSLSTLTAVALMWRSATRRAAAQTRETIELQERLEAARAREVQARDLIERMREGVVVLNDYLAPVSANAAARSMLGLGEGPLPHRLPPYELLPLSRRAMVDKEPAEATIDTRSPAATSLFVTASPLKQGGVVLVLRDVTEEQRTRRMRRQFVSHASHELRSPVAGIQTLAEAVQKAAQDDPQAARHFGEMLGREAARLGTLLDDLLDLSRLEEPTTVSNTVTDFSGVARAEWERHGDLAAAKSIALEEDIEEGVHVRGDASQLGQLVRNLLDNALRYTPDGGTVSLRFGRQERDAILEVADTGIGIPLRDQARIFERFYRVDESRSRNDGGTGLGLAIVRHITELHGGQVSVSSQLGEGSTFVVRIPSHQPGTASAVGVRRVGELSENSGDEE